MANVLTGLDFDIVIGGKDITVKLGKVTVKDGKKAKITRGVATGSIRGPITAEVELQLDHENQLIFYSLADDKDSFESIEPFDISFMAETSEGSKNVECFGCDPLLDNILDFKADGEEEDLMTIKAIVTDKRFIKLNGKPLLSADRTRGLTSNTEDTADG